MKFSTLTRLAVIATVATLASGCTIRFVDGPITDDDGRTNTTAGVGGNTAGNGGWGTTSSTTGQGGSTATTSDAGVATSSSSGGTATCVSGDGLGLTGDACVNLPIAAITSCNDGYAPAGLGVCERGFDLFAQASAEHLANCLSAIDTVDACTTDPAMDCVAAMYTDTCQNPVMADGCAAVESACMQGGEQFDGAACAGDLNPFSIDGANEVFECMNTTDGSCQDRYDTCLSAALQF